MSAPFLPTARVLPEHELYRDERLLELLADDALEGLDEHQMHELEHKLDGRVLAAPGFDQSVACLQVGMLRQGDVLEMPASLRERLLRSGQEWCRHASTRSMSQPAGTSAAAPRESADSVNVIEPKDVLAKVGPALAGGAAPGLSARERSVLARWAPWAMAAAAAVVALVSLVARPPQTDAPSLTAIATAPDAVKLAWADWDNPEVAGVQGDVVWSDAAQRGYMRFTNLPRLDATREQYQLWIVDSRGMEQRISGGVFNGTDGTTEVVVPITPGIRVVGAAAFAVTIERPEGTWVSDMKRRVVIAAKPG